MDHAKTFGVEIGCASADFLAAILNGDRRRALDLTRRMLPYGVDYLYERVIAPALWRVGELWADDTLTIADEHLAFALAQSTVASLYPEFAWPVGGPPAVVACVQGERHEFGGRMVADLLALDNWDAIFLGGDVPAEAFVEILARKNAKLAGLSVSLPLNMTNLQRVIAAVRAKLPQVPILLGGHALTSSPLHKGLGSDAIASTAAAGVALARRWKTA